MSTAKSFVDEMKADNRLWVVTYHYVRNVEGSHFPGIKGLGVEEFREQMRELSAVFEMASIESAWEFLAGRYRPRKDLCLFTFDDGLKEHFQTVLPILLEFGAQGLFGVITSCLEDHHVATVRMNHFLSAYGGFESYSKAFLERLARTEERALTLGAIDPAEARQAYPLDDVDIACFKVLVNFRLSPSIRKSVTRQLFLEWLGPEEEFANTLYMDWPEVRQLQSNGMVVAGHTHRHEPLAVQRSDEAESDLRLSKAILDRRLSPQPTWPFSYPYGKKSSFTEQNVQQVRACGFDCAFSTEQGPNVAHSDLYRLQRVDCNGVLDRVAAA